MWKVSIPGSAGPVADGYLSVSGTDGIQYVFGKGRSQTTVAAPSTPIEVDQSFTITGTVVDLSPAQPGTPAISDEDMGVWMEYLHKQHSKPTDAKGVTVELTAIDPNNNMISIGQAIGDTNGVFGFTWAPEVPGLYQIIATFAGSESYGSSSASTYLSAVGTPAEQAIVTEPEKPSLADQYLLPGIGIIVAAIAIVGAVLALMLRKKQ
jgi:hypothetical protein